MGDIVHITVWKEDKNKLMGECIKLFLAENPKFVGFNISQKFMFKKLIDFYLK